MATLSVIEDDATYPTLNSACAVANDPDIISIEGTWDDDDTTAVTILSNATITTDSSSKNPGYPHEGTGTWYRHRSASGHSITLGADKSITMTGVDIQNKSSGDSDEVFRIGDYTGDVTLTNCLLGFHAEVDEQDILYYTDDGGQTISFSFINCMFYDAGRSVIDFYAAVDCTATINFNSCSSYNIGGQGGRENGSWVGEDGNTSGSTITVNVFSCLIECQDTYAFSFGAAVGHVNCDDSITNVTSANLSNGENTEDAGVDNTFGATFTDGTGSSAVIYNETDPDSIDLRLTDHANNLAIDFHDEETGTYSGLSIPATDIIGTTKGAAGADYDCGAFEIEAAGPTGRPLPQRIFSGPFMGPLGGPV